MCKAPQPGRAKTRLAAVIGAETAAALSASFLRDVAAAIEAIPAELGYTGYGVYAPAGAENELRQVLPPSFRLLLQVDADFGNVLHGAARDLLAAGHDCVLLVNGDSPTLPTRLVADAVAALRRAGDRMVLGPASDGGYYLIGLKHAHRHAFAEIPWGTSDVARLTVARAGEIGLESVLLPEWYDVDDAESLDWLRAELAGRSTRFHGGSPAAATRECLARSPTAARRAPPATRMR
ncbi:MAG TPA: TIGR04282 family arsenosugar biosynthesis glycosyltransferase [Xanthobacteraceae bacterium]